MTLQHARTRLSWMPTAVLALLAITTMTNAQNNNPQNDSAMKVTPTLTVQGSAELDKPADELYLSLSVVSRANEAGDALDENSEQMDAVIKAITKAGLGDKEYETGRFRIQPQYTPRPRNADQMWRPEIIGYEVQNSIRVTTSKLGMAGELIDVSVAAGANSVESISFGISDPRKYRREAIREATTNAITDARTLADAAGLRLVRILETNLDHAQPRPYTPRMYAAEASDMAMAGRGARVATSIAPGDVTVNASVRIVYEISERK